MFTNVLYKNLSYNFILIFIVSIVLVLVCKSSIAIDIGAYYFPGWGKQTNYWNDIKGLPNSRSPDVPWNDRIPLIGYYDDTQESTMSKQINVASAHGINFFAFDWYWDGQKPEYADAIDNFMRVNDNKMKFAIMWANHSQVPKNLPEFESMIIFWNKEYFSDNGYYKVNNQPVVFIFSPDKLNSNALKFGYTSEQLLNFANKLVKKSFPHGLYFVGLTNAKPSNDVESSLKSLGYSGYSGWNYVMSENNAHIADYESMAATYMYYNNIARTTNQLIDYIDSASPGWDSRPWSIESHAYVRYNSNPESFGLILCGIKEYLDESRIIHNKNKIIMIEAWNEFGEGAYIEPTKGTGFGYLQEIKKIFEKETSCKLSH